MPSQARLAPRGLERLQSRHPWIFRGDLASLPEAEGGELVAVGDGRRPLAWGLWNPQTSLAFRLLSWGSERPHLPDLIRDRLRSALALRRRWCPGEETFRLVHGEADGLPGLVVDRYDDVLCLQLLSLGWYGMREEIVEALSELLDPTAVVLRNDVRALEREGLRAEKKVLRGALEAGESRVVALGEVKSLVYPLAGQKTGLYLDVRHFPRLLRGLCRGASVLDAFCFQGQFALHALRYGAERVTAVDQSAPALEAGRRGLSLSGLCDGVDWVCGNVFDVLRRFEEERRTFDVVVLDPPPFAPSRRQVESARRGYKDLALRGLRLLRSGGTLFFFCCSHAFGRDALLDVLREAALNGRRDAKVVAELHQPPDHPVLPHVAETDYLKGFVLEVF